MAKDGMRLTAYAVNNALQRGLQGDLKLHIAALEAEIAELKRSLESLTPGGSEFHDNPQRCVSWIKERISGPFAELKRDRERLDKLEAEIKKEPLLLHNLKCLEDWPKHPRGVGLLPWATPPRTLRQAIDAMQERSDA